MQLVVGLEVDERAPVPFSWKTTSASVGVDAVLPGEDAVEPGRADREAAISRLTRAVVPARRSGERDGSGSCVTSAATTRCSEYWYEWSWS